MENFTSLLFSEEGYTLIKAYSKVKKSMEYFLIDTGASHSFIFGKHCDYISDETDAKTRNMSNIEICISGKSFFHNFWMSNRKVGIKGKRISGILGADFLQKYHCAVDYRRNILSWSRKENIGKIMFSYPIHFGYKKLGIPVVGLGHKDNSICAIIDTGSCVNIIDMNTVYENCIGCQAHGEASLIELQGKKFAASPFSLTFRLVSIATGKLSELTYDSLFYIPESTTGMLSSIKCNLPISAILGSSFLRSNKWIIDFGNDLIYSQ